MATDLFGEVGSKLFANIFGSLLWFGLIAIIILVIGFFMWWFLIYQRRFDIKVKIISNRSQDKDSIIFDKAAILKDWKTKLPFLRVWGLKREFPVPRFNVLQKTDKGDYLEIYRKSEEDFYFLTPSNIVKTQVLKEGNKLIPIAEQEQTMSDPEMGFWSNARKKDNKRMFDTENILMKILAYMPQIIGGMLTVFILYILMDTLPGLIGELTKLTSELNRKQTAEVVTSTVGLRSNLVLCPAAAHAGVQCTL